MLRMKEKVIGLGSIEGRIVEFLHREKRPLPRDPVLLASTERAQVRQEATHVW